MVEGGVKAVPRAPSGPRFLLLALIAPAILFAAIVWIQHEAGRGESLRTAAADSYRSRFAAISLLGDLSDAETSQRGYVITGDPDFKLQYHSARQRVVGRMAGLSADFSNDRAQAHRLTQLEAATSAKFAEMETVIRLRESAGQDAATQRVRDGLGKRLMARIRSVANELISNEVATGEAQVAAFRVRSASSLRALWILVGVGSSALVLSLLLLWRRRNDAFNSDLAAFDAAERNETILNSTIDALLILNPSGTIETMNTAAVHMLGYQAEELLRRDISLVADLAPGSGSFGERIGLVDGILRNSWLTDRQVRHKDGHLVDVDISLGVMNLPDGTHVVASLRDISERRRIERLKDDFISTVSHELRSPLTSIIGALRLLSGRTAGQLSSQATRLVEIAEENARRLIRLINDMLDVDRMDSGKLRLTLRQNDMRDVITRGCQGNQGLAEAFGAHIRCSVPEAPLMAYCDADRLIQALTNLTSNALKVTPRGGTIDISCTRDEVTSRTVVCVDDQGPGIPEEFRSRIFGRFERALDDETKAGTGLGLAITREIIALHGGEIWFEDRPGGGTRFAFSIPVPKEARLAEGIAPEPKILIVKRDTTITEAIRSLLIEEGFDCRIASTADAAREAIGQDGLNLVLVDSGSAAFDALPDADKLRRQHPTDGLAVMEESGSSGGKIDPLAALRYLDWIDKPIEPTALKAAVRSALGHDERRPTVLHIDDDRDTLEVTAAALNEDAIVISALTLTDARQMIARQRPDLAIIDVDLAGESGLELLPDLVGKDGRSIPAIIFSAHDVSPQIGDDVDAIILKSGTSMPHLKATIRRIIKTQDRKREK